ncbi:hypothetical protein Acr_16g0001090 [Actinidia rufa]|uniref:Uncharacterized protein n=1 Tax=Actinidia rufa TaxID=165716 RepID=A0A7J0FXS6_9ERIC|nr:hypothetical protein Acr_16g0001090 [Actinidia rufa]
MSKRIKLNQLAKTVAEKAATSSSKGVVISEVSESPSKKRAFDDGSKGKEVALLPEAKKAKTTTGRAKIFGRGDPPRRQGEGGEVHLRSSGDQVPPHPGPGSHSGFFSLAVRSRDFVESANNQRALAESSELEMVRAQNRAIELEGALVEVNAKQKKAAKEVKAKNKEVARLEARVAKLEKSQALAKGGSLRSSKSRKTFKRP